MRYIRYSGNIPDPETIRKEGKALSAQMRREHRRVVLLHKVGNVVFGAVFLGGFVVLCLLISWLKPTEEGVFGIIFSALFTIVMGLVALIVAAIVGAIAATPLWGFWQRSEKAALRQTLNEACADIRQFYQFNEPFLVTKCYRSSDKRFDRHDVCLFTIGDELRLTANLHYGFFDPKRDLGCYCLTRQEIRLSETCHKDRPAIELQADGVHFVLGQKARAYITTYLGRDA